MSSLWGDGEGKGEGFRSGASGLEGCRGVIADAGYRRLPHAFIAIENQAYWLFFVV